MSKKQHIYVNHDGGNRSKFNRVRHNIGRIFIHFKRLKIVLYEKFVKKSSLKIAP